MSMSQNLKRSVCLYSLLCGSFVSIPAHAQSMQEAMRQAIENHPIAQQSQSAIGMAEEDKASARSGFFPEINFGVTGGRVYQDNATSRGLSVTRGAAYSGYGEGTASLRQMIFDGNSTLNRFRASNSEKKSAEFQLIDTQEQIAFNTALRYVSILQAREVLAKLENHQKEIRDYSARIEDMVNEGAADGAELQQAKRLLSLLDSLRTDYLDQLRREEANFQELTGVPAYDDMEKPVLIHDWIPENEAAAIEVASFNHPAIMAAKEKVEVAAHQVDAERGELYPEIFGELSYLEQDKREQIGGELTDARAVLRMNWQLETGGGQLANIARRKYEQTDAMAKEDGVRRQVERDIRLAYTQKATTQRRIKEQQEQLDLNKQLYATYKTQFDGGLVTLLQLMQAQDQLFSSEIQMLVNGYQDLGADIGIIASLGRLQQVVLNEVGNNDVTFGVGASPAESALNE